MLKRIFAPHLGHDICFGRRPSSIHCALPVHKFSKYLLKALPTPAPKLDLTPLALPSLRNILLNATLGCCVIAGGYHQVGVGTGNSGNGIFVPTDKQVINDYGLIGGYKPNDPSTDNGCDLMTAAKVWSTVGFANGDKIVGVLALDPTNPTQLMQSLTLFESGIFGVGLPDAYVDPMPSADNFKWGLAGPANQDNGHCFVGVGFDAAIGIRIDTWALFGWFTWDAIAAYASAGSDGELYLFLTQEMVNRATGKAPSGFDWPTLAADFASWGGVVSPSAPPIPMPTPTPVPVPTPTPVPVPVPTPPVPVPVPTPPPVPPAPAPVPPAPKPPVPVPGPGPGHQVVVEIDGVIGEYTYYSRSNPHRPKGKQVFLEIAGVTRLDGVLIEPAG